MLNYFFDSTLEMDISFAERLNIPSRDDGITNERLLILRAT